MLFGSCMGAARGIFGRIRPLAAAGILAAALSCAALGAVPAWAAEAHPVQSAVEAGADGACIVNVVELEGAGETVYVTVTQGGGALSEPVPRTIGEDGGDLADLFALEADGENDLAESLAAGVTVGVYADEACKEPLYEGSVWPVYAELGGTEKLIGAHTGSGGFTAPGSVLVDGKAYRLADDAEKSDDGKLVFAYEEYEPANSVEGSIRYVDAKTGEALSAYTSIPGLVAGDEPRAVEVPQIVESDGKAYRTMSLDAVVYASNPGATSFSVPVVELTDEASSSAGHYMAVIRFLDAQTGETVASDAVYVRGEVSYTTPDTIYQAAGAKSAAEEYDRAAGEPAVLKFSAQKDNVTTGSQTFDVRYDRAAPGKGSAATFSLIDGSKRVGDATRTIGSFQGGLPPASYTDAAGNEFELVGDPSDYGPLSAGVADAYYLPKGYSAAQEPYKVKVSYVDYATREIIDSEEFESSPDDLADIVFEPPAQFAKDGITWLRLDGQESISHSYWSRIAEYTVYYRDRSKPLESVPVITQVRVVYRDGGTTTVDAGTATTAGTATPAGTAAGTAAGGTATADTGGTATGEAPAEERLDSGQAYNVAQGQGTSQQAVGQDGRDATQQRIDENENPLASGTDDQAGQGPSGIVIAGIVIGIIAAIAVIVAFAIRRRGRQEL